MRLPKQVFCSAALACCIGFSVTASQAADPALIAAAKREGHVTWYTAQIIDALVRPLSAAFENKYGIKVDYVREDPSQIALRVLNEARAGKLSADVVDSAQAAAGLKKEGLILKWQPDFVKQFPKEYVDPDGYWVATQSYSLMLGYNTDLVKRGTEPQNWTDLLDPKWKGRMVWSVNATPSSGPGFVGLVLSELGEDKGMTYLKQLAKQDIAGVQGSARQVLDLAISGEYAIALQIYPNHVLDSQALGAPIARYMLQPSMRGNFNQSAESTGSVFLLAFHQRIFLPVGKDGVSRHSNSIHLGRKDGGSIVDGFRCRIGLCQKSFDLFVVHWFDADSQALCFGEELRILYHRLKGAPIDRHTVRWRSRWRQKRPAKLLRQDN
jgi:iron(III) transport system substrate-binding protein